MDTLMENAIEIYSGGYSTEELTAAGKEVVQWPESQTLFDMPYYLENCELINDEIGLNLFGSSAYVVNSDWYYSVA